MEKCFNKLKLTRLVRLHLHQNEDLGSLQTLGWRSLRQQLMAPIP